MRSVLTQTESGSDRVSSCHGHRVAAIVRQARGLTYYEPTTPDKEMVCVEVGRKCGYLPQSLLL